MKDLGLVVSDKKIDKNNIFETYLYDAVTYLGNKLVPFKTRVTKLLFWVFFNWTKRYFKERSLKCLPV